MSAEPLPFLDLAAMHREILPELESAFRSVVESSGFIGGEELRLFEEEFADAHHRARAVGCASGTDALSLALHACGVGPGDEVVVPAMTFVATAEAVVHVGATPVIADVDPDTLLLSQDAVAAVQSERTRAVIPVHLFGHIVPFDDLRAWHRAGLIVVEDAAQAHLGEWRGERIGDVGRAACFSFYPGKNLGALGDAGALLTDDEDMALAARIRRDHGRSDKYRHDAVGVASRLDGLQAAFLRVKLRYLEAWTEKRRVLADRYRAGLEGTALRLVPWEEGAVHHLLCVRIDAALRDDLRTWLANSGIGTGVHYPIDLSTQPATAAFAPNPCVAAKLAAQELISLPIGPELTETQVERVCDRAIEFCGTAPSRTH